MPRRARPTAARAGSARSIHADRAAGSLEIAWRDGHEPTYDARDAALALPVRVLPGRGRPARLARLARRS